MNGNDLQVMSEQIRDHLTKQKARAMSMVPVVSATEGDTAPRCRYRGDNGTMCAIGCLIPDERYNTALEGYSGDTETVVAAVLGADFDGMSFSMRDRVAQLFTGWQYYHDHGPYKDWSEDAPGYMSPADVHQSMVNRGVFGVGGEK